MATYNEFERKVIAALVELDSTPGGLNVLGNIWEDFFPNSYIVKLAEATLACIHFRPSALPRDNLAFAEVDKQFRTTAYRMIRVFERLEKDGQIAFVGNIELELLGEHFVDEQYVAYNIKDHDLLGKIRTLAQKQILVYPELHDLVKNDFVDAEVKKMREDVRKDRRTLFFAVMGLLLAGLGTAFTAYDKFFKPAPGPTKIEITNPTITVQPPSGASSAPVHAAPAPPVSAPTASHAAVVPTPAATPVPPASPAASATVPSVVMPSNPPAVTSPVQPVPTAAPAP